VWDRTRYEQLFAPAPVGVPRGESTPFYLYRREAHEALHAAVPQARLVAVLRDPVDRAYSNWMHLRSDGLEPQADFLRALEAEPARTRRGWAPFWHYRGMGLYGEQLRDLFRLFPREQVHVLRYRELVDTPAQALAAVYAFLGVEAPPAAAVRAAPENVKPFVPPGPRNDLLRRAVRTGAWAGQWLPPQAWRRASAPLIRSLHAGGSARPPLDPEQRRRAVALFAQDIALLGTVLDRSFDDWLGDRGRGAFVTRQEATSPSE
jgi:hypothetical protein